MTTLTVGTHKGIGTLSTLFAQARLGIWTVMKHHAERRALRKMLQLDDHLLSDVGLIREDVERVRDNPGLPLGAELARIRAHRACL